MAVMPIRKSLSLEQVAANTNKRYGEKTMIDGMELKLDPPRLPFGVFSVDYAIGGGTPMWGTTGLWGPERGGKGGLETDPVLTPSGWVRYKDLRPGSLAIAEDGTAIPITDVFRRGELPVFRVSFSDKTWVVVDGDHLWRVQTRKQRKLKSRNFRLFRTVDLMEGEVLDGSGEPKYTIPLVQPVQFRPEISPPLPPYIMGALLANGSLEQGVVTTNDTGVVTEMRRAGKNEGIRIKEHAPTNTARRWYLSGSTPGKNTVRTGLRAVGLWEVKAAGKFIPPEYFLSSVPDRAVLLQALMDCDGSVEKESSSGGGARYYSRSVRLALGVIELAQSLGGTARLSSQVDEDGKTDYRVSLLLPKGISPFKACQKKVRRYAARKRRLPVRKIVSIEAAGLGEVICIAVAGEKGLYVTKDYIVTHNTSLAKNALKMAAALCWGCFNLAEFCTCSKKQLRMKALFADVEGTFHRGWAHSIGVPEEGAGWKYLQADYGEQYVDIICDALQADDCGLVVMDSLAELIPEKELEASASDEFYAKQAVLITRAMRKFRSLINTEHKRGKPCCMILVNQMRAKIGIAFGDKETQSGGHALKHEFFVLLRVAQRAGLKTKEEEEEEVKTGSKTVRHVFTLRKDKVQTLGVSGEFVRVRQDIPEMGLLKGQIDDFNTVLSYAQEYGLIVKEKSGWKYRDSYKVPKLDIVKDFWKKKWPEYAQAQIDIVKAAKDRLAGGKNVEAKSKV